MKRGLLNGCLLAVVLLYATVATAQNPDQNPNYRISQDRYMAMADSVTAWHGTTPQETYHAIDYLANKQEARDARKAFRRELRLERARGWYNVNDYYPTNSYGGYNYGYYSPYSNWSTYFWNTLPLAVTLGLLCR
ncbi:MAG: hypothetical protein QM731_20335 [Chitinophagaceae bacterium]